MDTEFSNVVKIIYRLKSDNKNNIQRKVQVKILNIRYDCPAPGEVYDLYSYNVLI